MEVTAFRHQVGGHFGILLCNGHVAKPFNLREMAFYTMMTPELKRFSPGCCMKVTVRATINASTGGVELETDEKADCHTRKSSSKHESSKTRFKILESGRVAVDTEKSWNPWASECQCKVVENMLTGAPTPFMLLENIVAHYTRPCVLDLKIGTRQHGDDASESKRHRQLMKCRQSTSSSLGVRIVGMQLYDPEAKRYNYVEKMEGRRIDENGFRNYVKRFVNASGMARASRMRQRLRLLRSLLTESEGYRFFSASILIAFDAEAADSTPDDSVKVNIIDFAHSTFTGFFEDSPYRGVDEGCILGIDSILQAMEPTSSSASSSKETKEYSPSGQQHTETGAGKEDCRLLA